MLTATIQGSVRIYLLASIRNRHWELSLYAPPPIWSTITPLVFVILRDERCVTKKKLLSELSIPHTMVPSLYKYKYEHHRILNAGTFTHTRCLPDVSGTKLALGSIPARRTHIGVAMNNKGKHYPEYARQTVSLPVCLHPRQFTSQLFPKFPEQKR